MSEESPSVYKLPLEVMGLIMLKLDNQHERQLEEIKKCRQISPRWYRAVQVLYQDQLFEKCLTHFDGLQQTYGKSRRFGLNVFGKFPVDFATFKISYAEYYLMNNWLPNMGSTNLVQNLILQDNRLNLKELLEVLKKFPNIVNFEFVQTSKYMDVAKKMCQLYANPEDKSDNETIEMIQNELEGCENFLQKLKIINFKIVHASVLNFFNLILSCSQYELEEISIEFNIIGIVRSLQKPQSIQKNEVNFKNFELGQMTQLNKFSKSLKKMKITAMYPTVITSWYYDRQRVEAAKLVISRLVQSIFNIFNENQFRDLKNIQELEIKIWRDQFCYNDCAGLLDFIKSQNNLSKVEIGVIPESFGPSKGESQVDQNSRSIFLESLSTLGVQFGYQVSKFGLNPIIRFSENLGSLEVDIQSNTTWRFSDHQVKFPNCTSLIIRNICYTGNPHWPNFEIDAIVKKFQNLKSLDIEDRDYYFWNPTARPQVLNQDLQDIIKHCSNLEKLSLQACIFGLGDPGLTGFTSESLEARRYSPNLPLLAPEERTGLPISHLKNLVELRLNRQSLPYRDLELPDSATITDLSAVYGFKYEAAPKLKSLSILKSRMTNSGIEVLKRKLPTTRIHILAEAYGFMDYD